MEVYGIKERFASFRSMMSSREIRENQIVQDRRFILAVLVLFAPEITKTKGRTYSGFAIIEKKTQKDEEKMA